MTPYKAAVELVRAADTVVLLQHAGAEVTGADSDRLRQAGENYTAAREGRTAVRAGRFRNAGGPRRRTVR